MSERVAGRWFEIALHLSARDVDAASGVLAAAGYSGCEVIEHEGERAEMRLHVRCETQDAARKRAFEIERTLARFEMRAAVRSEIDERIWREDWKRHFKRTAIGRRLEIVAPWETERAPDRIAVVINPGLAFGTGQHETTAGCLELLEELIDPGAAVLDLGCGSGILAIAAAKLGARTVVAIDNDPEAVNSTKENAVLNGVACLVDARLADGAPTGDAFDVAVANILAETLVSMAADLTSCVTPDGRLVLSGIESERRPLVEVAFSAHGWQLTRAIERSGWVSLALSRRAGERRCGR